MDVEEPQFVQLVLNAQVSVDTKKEIHIFILAPEMYILPYGSVTHLRRILYFILCVYQNAI